METNKETGDPNSVQDVALPPTYPGHTAFYFPVRTLEIKHFDNGAIRERHNENMSEDV